MKLDYTIKRSPRRRKVTITVERDRRVIVHAPDKVPEARIRKLVDNKRQWLFEKLHHSQKYRSLPHPPGKELVNGESALYLGRNYRIELSDIAESVQFHSRFVIPRSRARRRRQALRHWYIERAELKIPPRVRMYARRLGVTFNDIKFTDSRYRWGSCSPAGNLNFNWRLIKAPKFVIDYVIIHELAHLLEANHTTRFWNIVSAQTTSMTAARQWLRDNGQDLEEEI